MKLRNTFLFLALTATIFCGFSAQNTIRANSENILSTNSNQGGYLVHIVQKGETVYSIATNYSTTVSEIHRLNPDSEKGIKVGDILRLPKNTITGYKEHKIESKETLYSVSKMYEMTIDDILDANPNLDEKNFKSGKKIQIPIYGAINKNTSTQSDLGMEHKVEKGETLYSISKLYDISVNELVNTNSAINDKGLKVGMTLVIPDKEPASPTPKPSDSNTPAPSPKGEVLNIGILLPFLDEKGSVQKDKIAEYYEGFLLAIKEMKEKGLNANVYAFNIGAANDTKRLESLLGTTELNNLNLIIGGVSNDQINVISTFAKKRKINYVVPFGTQNIDLKPNPNLFQIVNSHSNLYEKVATNFINRFKTYNIVFVEEMGNDKNKSDFTTVLKNKLKSANVLFKTISPSASLTNDLNGTLDSSKSNILIPASSSEVSLKRMMPALKANEGQAITLFGYPEWQAYANYTTILHKYDAYIYSSFFFDEADSNSRKFVDDYKKWYNKKLINSYPRFGCLGYDTGLYFMSALKQYGKHFESNINSVKTDLLQSPMSFDHDSSDSYYINAGLYFVHYKSDKSIEKIDCSK